MSIEDKTEAEHWIESAIIVLKYIPHDDVQLREMASAIESYGSGHFRAAAIVARAVVKPSNGRRFPQHWIPRPKSLEELKDLFRDVRLNPRLIGSPTTGAPARDLPKVRTSQ